MLILYWCLRLCIMVLSELGILLGPGLFRGNCSRFRCVGKEATVADELKDSDSAARPQSKPYTARLPALVAISKC